MLTHFLGSFIHATPRVNPLQSRIVLQKPHKNTVNNSKICIKDEQNTHKNEF